MSMTDPIADLLTHIRNATTVRHDRTDVPASKMKLEVAKIFKQEGFIRTFKVIEEGPQGTIRIYLKYADDGEPVIHGLQRVSRSSFSRFMVRVPSAISPEIPFGSLTSRVPLGPLT